MSGGRAAFEELRWTPEAASDAYAHARESYPEECCGFLLGPWDGSPGPVRTVVRIVRAANARSEERTHRFVIPAPEVLALERSLEGGPESISGFYHSHPDHPARPSEYDREHAWPGYAYVVLAVARQGITGAGAFELDPEERTFHPRRLLPSPGLPGPRAVP
jgi:proteasome lid subunit RPN8/RPN11